VRPVIGHYQGRVVKTIGDAFLSVFESPTNAVLCAIIIQHVLYTYNLDRNEKSQLHIRIAVNAGDVQVAEDGDVFGEAVNATARLESVTTPDEVFFTEQVYLTINRNEIPKTLQVNTFSFKGIPDEVKVYRVIQDNSDETYRKIIDTRIPVGQQKTDSDGTSKRSQKTASHSGHRLYTLKKHVADACSGWTHRIPPCVNGPRSKRLPVSPRAMAITAFAGLILVFTIAFRILTGSSTLTNSLDMAFISVSPGTFQMGSPSVDKTGFRDEIPHSIRIEKGFHLQETEVRVRDWRVFAKRTGYRTEAEKMDGCWLKKNDRWTKENGIFWDNPGFPQTDDHPVTCVSWNDTQAFIDWLNRQGDMKYRLPYETEWEYACRAGSDLPAYSENPATNACSPDETLETKGWYCSNAGEGTHPCGRKEKNARGFSDMQGNVWEWCRNWYVQDIGKENGISGPETGILRAGRGGGWNSIPLECMPTYRYGQFPGRRTNTLGFRLVMMEPEKTVSESN